MKEAVGRYAGLTGSPYDSGANGAKRGCPGRAMRVSGAAWSNWPGVGSGSQKDSQLTQWYNSRTESARGDIRKTMIVGTRTQIAGVAVALCDDR